MCQKAFGSFFAPLTGVPLSKFEVTRGAFALFRSSDLVERGFCRDCGTPLSFRFVNSDRISVSIGSLDEPEKVEPTHQFGNEARLSWFAKLPDLPGGETTTRPTRPNVPPTSPPRTTSIPITTRRSGRRPAGEGDAMAEPRLTGGCQCGAVRYALLTQPDNPHICHCRMCQKAFGSYFAPLAGVPLDKFEITRGDAREVQ